MFSSKRNRFVGGAIGVGLERRNSVVLPLSEKIIIIIIVIIVIIMIIIIVIIIIII